MMLTPSFLFELEPEGGYLHEPKPMRAPTEVSFRQDMGGDEGPDVGPG